MLSGRFFSNFVAFSEYLNFKYPDFYPRASNRRERVINQTEIQSEETIGEPTANLDENIRQLENDNKVF